MASAWPGTTRPSGARDPDGLRLGDEVADRQHKAALADHDAAARPLLAERLRGVGVLGIDDWIVTMDLRARSRSKPRPSANLCGLALGACSTRLIGHRLSSDGDFLAFDALRHAGRNSSASDGEAAADRLLNADRLADPNSLNESRTPG